MVVTGRGCSGSCLATGSLFCRFSLKAERLTSRPFSLALQIVLPLWVLGDVLPRAPFAALPPARSVSTLWRNASMRLAARSGSATPGRKRLRRSTTRPTDGGRQTENWCVGVECSWVDLNLPPTPSCTVAGRDALPPHAWGARQCLLHSTAESVPRNVKRWHNTRRIRGCGPSLWTWRARGRGLG